MYLHLFGQGLIFLNDPAAVTKLMERRSAIYSDRAPLVMATELLVHYTRPLIHRRQSTILPFYFFLAVVQDTWYATWRYDSLTHIAFYHTPRLHLRVMVKSFVVSDGSWRVASRKVEFLNTTHL